MTRVFVDWVGQVGKRLCRTSAWLEDDLDCVDVQMFGRPSEDETKTDLLRDGEGVDYDGFNVACAILDRRTPQISSGQGTKNSKECHE